MSYMTLRVGFVGSKLNHLTSGRKTCPSDLDVVGSPAGRTLPTRRDLLESPGLPGVLSGVPGEPDSPATACSYNVPDCELLIPKSSFTVRSSGDGPADHAKRVVALGRSCASVAMGSWPLTARLTAIH